MNFPHLAQRLFNVPLAIHPRKAEVVMAALSERLGVSRIMRLDGNAVTPMAGWNDGDEDFSASGRNPRAGYDLVEGVAVIQVQGTLVQKLGTLRPWSGMTGYDGIRQNFLTALSDPEVGAIALDIDSPGGEVAGCFDLVDTIHQARGQKPIWSILDESAYSAGYAIASAADRIVVPRTGGTGSIGVIAMHVDLSQALSAAGITVTVINYGERKADGAPEFPLSPEALERFQADIDTMGELFVETVARNRALPAAKVRDTQAATYLGASGVELGLADEVMAPDAAFLALLQALG
ncbi:MAG: S49 family peptidase [Betaproteobacteria bacterium]|nr:S49 family peptidase [Betaproteobacteria bacterium]